MFKITNILQADIRAQGQALIKECERLGVRVSYDKTEVTPSGRAERITDETEQRKRLMSAVSLKWVAPRSVIEANLSDSSKRALEQEEWAADYFRVVDSNAVGFERLRPGESVELIHDIKIVEALIKSSHAEKIRITDTETGDVIFEGKIRPITRSYIIINQEKKREKQDFESVELINAIHPQGKLEYYYPSLAVKVVEEIKTEPEPKTSAKKTSSILSDLNEEINNI
jgi:hypothetical protein